MAKEHETGTAKLKLVHLVYGLFASAVIIGIVIGKMSNQQETNTDDIKLKVNKEIFTRHEIEQQRQFKGIQKTMGDGFTKLEKSIEKLVAK